MAYKTLGKLIKAEREMRGWEQADLSAMVGVGQQAISRWEKGNSRPRQDDLAKLVDIFSGEISHWSTLAGYQIEEPDESLMPYLPLYNLTPEKFELFSKDLVQCLYPNADVHRYGTQGYKQGGIDLFVNLPDGVLAYQVKKRSQFGVAAVKQAVSSTTFKAKHYYILLSRRATPVVRDAMKKYPKWSLWDLDDLSSKVKHLPEVGDAVRMTDMYFPGKRTGFLGVKDPSPWQPPNEFYQTYLDTERLFSHGWRFVGRKKELNELKKFTKNKKAQAILLSGRGGIGKSRLLKKWADGIKKPTKVVFLSLGLELRPEDLEKLPNGPAYLVIDDAHDRGDLTATLSGIARTRRELKLVISTRPYGLTRLEDDLARSGVSYDPDMLINVSDLTEEEAEKLSKEILVSTNGDASFAKKIAKITRDCPLATVVGSKLVGQGKIRPEFLSNSEKFQKELLRRFRNVVTGEIGGTKNTEAISRLLNLMAMIQPVEPSNPNFQKAAEKILNKRFSEITRDIHALEEAGVLLRRGRYLRIVPDLLADYIRADSSYDEKSNMPTGYADEVFEIVENELATNLLINIGQLDWRLSTKGIRSSLLDEVWSNLKKQFRKAKIFDRATILTALEKVAYYQPEKLLDFVQIALKEPTNKVEKNLTELAFGKFSYQYVLNKIPPILRYVAYDSDYLIQALDTLKKLAETDNRQTNPHPEHPVRVLQELASYVPGKPSEYNKAVANHAITWLQQKPVGKFSPFDVLDEFLQTEGHETESEGFKIIMKPFKVNPEAVIKIRQRVIDAAFEVIAKKSPNEAIRAVKTISAGLDFPRGIFNQKISGKDKAAWEPGIIDILKRLEKIVKNESLDPIISVEIRKAVSWHAVYSKTASKAAAQRVLNAIPTTIRYEVSRALVDSWGWTFERDSNGRRNRDAVAEWRKKVAKDLLNHYGKNLSGLAEMLDERMKTIRLALTSEYPDAGPFLADIMEHSLEFTKFLGKKLLSDPESPLADWFNVVIIMLAKKDRQLALSFMKRAVKTKSKTISRCLAFALGRGLYDLQITDGEVKIIKQLSTAKDSQTRQLIVPAVKRFPQEKKPLALDILLGINLGTSAKLADAVLEEFDDKHGTFKVTDLSKEQLEKLLDQLTRCPSIDEYHVGLFLSELSSFDPLSTLKLLIDRVEHKEADPKASYEPFSYSWTHDAPLRFHETVHYEKILRLARNWASEKSKSWVRLHYGTNLFKLVSSSFDRTTIRVLEEWIMSADEEQLKATAHLLREANNNFVWDNKEFVVKLLEQAQKHGDDCYKSVCSSLYSSVIQGEKSGTPGEPFPRDIRQRDRAEKTMANLPPGSPAQKFYKNLYKSALNEIKRQTERDLDF